VISVQPPLFHCPCIFGRSHVIGRCDPVCHLGRGLLFILRCLGVGYVVCEGSSASWPGVARRLGWMSRTTGVPFLPWPHALGRPSPYPYPSCTSFVYSMPRRRLETPPWEDRRGVTRKTRSAIHWGALPIYLPLTGYQQANARGPAANAVCFTSD
jgi:hypothetical protein